MIIEHIDGSKTDTYTLSDTDAISLEDGKCLNDKFIQYNIPHLLIYLRNNGHPVFMSHLNQCGIKVKTGEKITPEDNADYNKKVDAILAGINYYIMVLTNKKFRLGLVPVEQSNEQ